jgi:hypothetical protein
MEQLTMNNPRRIQRHLVKALAAGALLAAAALPLAIATEAGAVTAPTLTSLAFTPHGATANSYGADSTGTVAITGTGFADDGGNVTLTATGTGEDVTFTSVTETSATTATATYTDSGSTPATAYGATLVDDNGTASLASAFTVDAAPTISGVSPAAIFEGSGANVVTVTGANFQTGATVTLVNTNDTASGGSSHGNGTPLTATVTTVTAGSITLSVTPTNSVTSATATPGLYSVTVTNPDGGSVTDGAPNSGSTVGTGPLTVEYGIQDVSPSAVPLVTTVGSTTAITINGAGFEIGATVAVSGTVCAGTSAGDDSASITGVNVTSQGTITANLVLAPAVSTDAAAECELTVTNPGTGAGGNAAVYTLGNGTTTGAIGLGESATVAPVVTASNSSTVALVAGAASTSVTVTGTGFSQYSTPTSETTGVAFGAPTGSTGTTLTFPVTVEAGAGGYGSDATTGPIAGEVVNTAGSVSGASNVFSPVALIAGPSLTSAAPAALAVKAAYGTTLTITGTGFTNTITTTTIGGGTGLGGVLTYVSPTSLSFVVTSSPTTAGTATIAVTESTGSGDTVTSNALSIKVDADPTLGALTYKTTPINDVGVGATAQTIYIAGSGFATGATVGKFVNGNGVADPDVTATVTAVTPTQITATVAVTAGDTNTEDGYTVTNPDGGTASTSALLNPLTIGAGPTITSITPATGTAGTTTSFAVVGTGFETGAVVSLSPANGTCGTATVSAATTLAATCTLGQPSSVGTDLVVTNPDGGSATSTTAILAASSSKPAPKFHVSGAHGAAVAGKTVTITITGTGFYGQPKITSSGSTFKVSKDNGRVLTVRVTTKAGTKAGERELTVRLANGKTGKAGYNTKA